MVRLRRRNHPRGFTLVEGITAIAVISILTGVVLASLSGARTQSRLKAAQAAMNATRPAAQACLAKGLTLSNPVMRTPVCTGSQARWPELPPTWAYVVAQTQSDVNAQTFQYQAQSGGTAYRCNQTTCLTP